MTRKCPTVRNVAYTILLSTVLVLEPASLAAQQGRATPPALRAAGRLNIEGKTAEARRVLQAALDSVADAAAQADFWRALAMTYAFDGDCANTARYEQLVIDYWKTREQAEPQNAFYQEGERANEAARVCIDAGDLATAEKLYRLGSDLGNKEPAPRTHPRSLWDYRLAHALGRIAARRGDAAEAQRQIAAARKALDADTAMARQQERYFPYLVGYVALYTNDLTRAQQALSKAVSVRGNERDPFMHALLAMAYEKAGDQAKADALYRQAFDMATASNPPAAYVRPLVRKKLGVN